nr:VanZ family protein [Acidobacteriota bacterium]
NWIREALSAAHQDRLARLLVAVAAAWMFVNLAPFDITVDLGDLAARVRTKRISLVPFGHDLSWPRRIWDVVAETLSAIPLGLLGVSIMQARRRRVWPGAFLVGAAIVIVVEGLQVFIKSHSADTADAMLGSAGVAVGVWMGTRVMREAVLAPSGSPPATMSMRAAAVVGLWCIVLGAYHWVPYDFSIDNDLLRRKLARLSILPFAGYLGGSYLNALNNLLTKLALAIPLGVAAGFVTRHRKLAFSSTTLAWLLSAGALFGLIEAGQLFLPRRNPDPTDVLVGMVGTYVGLSLARWLKAEGRVDPSTGSKTGNKP